MALREAPSIAAALETSPRHLSPGHPEHPSRLEAIASWWAHLESPSILRVASREAEAAQLAAVHPPSYLAALQGACLQGPGYIDPAPTYVTPQSYDCALLAAGGTLAVLDEILEGRARSGFAIVRPPGHHATADQAMGFCLLNNVALAVRRAQSRGLRRAMVFDFDVHHGNGTQAIFEADADVLYISTHQEGIYPLTGWAEEVGVGSGRGMTINNPLPAGTGDQGLLSVFDRVVAPAAARFGPDLILVSAGFDAHWRDPLAGFQVTTKGFYAIASRLVELAESLSQGRLLFALEGGYDPGAVAEGVLACLAAVQRQPLVRDDLGPAPAEEPDVSDRITRSCAIHDL